MTLNNKVAVVTGAASGIGEQCARKLAAQGAKVVIADLSLKNAQQVATSIDESGGRAFAVEMNVIDEDAVSRGIDAAVEKFGSVDVLVSNAGIQIVNPIENYAFADWKKMLAVHLDGAFLTTKAAIRHMYDSGRGGSIIYMGSVHSHEASKLKSAYVTAKHGLLGLARVVAKEGGPRGVRANVVCPGFVRTPLVDKQIPEQAKELGISEQEVIRNVMLGDTVDGEFTTIDDVANTVAFLAGFESAALTGQSIVVSHGWYMQ
ncbi:3-hydroxybutyrate dehydrogenase [Paraburkholderia sp. SOS3]|uniref:3-hydroxybutyrate dehydrogenase n=1 Tax=Paraburkholderia sp. SOS3 TaxID=1926494 RepID=UPI000947537D|nr:3-hydroxybutyrate dehydrogenase [Paraburkholderia sp. SOS3]APR39681.1 3-hydroxybutyrate dehydrogenase [Paraburkholderia sp. SOS3]